MNDLLTKAPQYGLRQLSNSNSVATYSNEPIYVNIRPKTIYTEIEHNSNNPISKKRGSSSDEESNYAEIDWVKTEALKVACREVDRSKMVNPPLTTLFSNQLPESPTNASKVRKKHYLSIMKFFCIDIKKDAAHKEKKLAADNYCITMPF